LFDFHGFAVNFPGSCPFHRSQKIPNFGDRFPDWKTGPCFQLSLVLTLFCGLIPYDPRVVIDLRGPGKTSFPPEHRIPGFSQAGDKPRKISLWCMVLHRMSIRWTY